MSDDTREATDEEDRMIRYLSRVIGQTLMHAWHQLPPELREGQSMTQCCLAAIAHNLGTLLAASPQENLAPDDPRWHQFLETTAAMVKKTAIEAYQTRVAQAQTSAEQSSTETPPAEGETPKVSVPAPKFVM